MKNQRIRVLMMKTGITQVELGKILGVSEGETSVMLKRELARSEQDSIIEAIKRFLAEEAAKEGE